MTASEWAAKLHGREFKLFGGFLSEDECAQAAKDDVVIIYGYSDDLLELEGAVDEEYAAWGGLNGRVIRGVRIDAIWSPKSVDASWLIIAPGFSFDIIEGNGSLFCRGSVVPGKLFRYPDNQEPESREWRIVFNGDDDCPCYMFMFVETSKMPGDTMERNGMLMTPHASDVTTLRQRFGDMEKAFNKPVLDERVVNPVSAGNYP